MWILWIKLKKKRCVYVCVCVYFRNNSNECLNRETNRVVSVNISFISFYFFVLTIFCVSCVILFFVLCIIFFFFNYKLYTSSMNYVYGENKKKHDILPFFYKQKKTNKYSFKSMITVCMCMCSSMCIYV